MRSRVAPTCDASQTFDAISGIAADVGTERVACQVEVGGDGARADEPVDEERGQSAHQLGVGRGLQIRNGGALLPVHDHHVVVALSVSRREVRPAVWRSVWWRYSRPVGESERG